LFDDELDEFRWLTHGISMSENGEQEPRAGG